jgi:hypothetical protein
LADVSEELTAFVIRVLNELYAEKSGSRYGSRLDKAELWPCLWREGAGEPVGEGGTSARLNKKEMCRIKTGKNKLIH